MQRYIEWLLSLFYWDGVLPVAVITVPTVVKLLFPKFPGAWELTFIIVPVAAFVLRYVHGLIRFSYGEMYVWQLLVFFLAIFVLFALDAILVMVQLVQNVVQSDAYLTAAAIYCVYLSLMAIALYPAREPAAGECGTNDVDAQI